MQLPENKPVPYGISKRPYWTCALCNAVVFSGSKCTNCGGPRDDPEELPRWQCDSCGTYNKLERTDCRNGCGGRKPTSNTHVIVTDDVEYTFESFSEGFSITCCHGMIAEAMRESSESYDIELFRRLKIPWLIKCLFPYYYGYIKRAQDGLTGQKERQEAKEKAKEDKDHE